MLLMGHISEGHQTIVYFTEHHTHTKIELIMYNL